MDVRAAIRMLLAPAIWVIGFRSVLGAGSPRYYRRFWAGSAPLRATARGRKNSSGLVGLAPYCPDMKRRVIQISLIVWVLAACFAAFGAPSLGTLVAAVQVGIGVLIGLRAMVEIRDRPLWGVPAKNRTGTPVINAAIEKAWSLAKAAVIVNGLVLAIEERWSILVALAPHAALVGAGVLLGVSIALVRRLRSRAQQMRRAARRMRRLPEAV